ncbi:hypothetical protein [Streptomyces violascens]|uniref:hypothetical protein n=1 Tax=Streptomyces violascens TaxID=67381 RepID=UPI0016753CD6|nr:hypothetical protein [Streptomyces violascens]GGU39173.1 hypothetical protein GCM10010289_70090 [Streptomyces violascens]
MSIPYRSTTTTLPDRTKAVVHSYSLTWDKATLWGNGGLANLGATVIEYLRSSGSCLAIQHEDLGVIVTPHRAGGNELTARVLCTDPACYTAAERDEQEFSLVPHPDAPTARAWATRRAAAGEWQLQVWRESIAHYYPGPAVPLRSPEDR